MSRVFFNGVDLKATYNFVVQAIDDPFNIDVPTVELSARDGAIYFDDLARVDRRTITLRGQIYGTSHPDVMSKIIGLKKLIASSNNRGKLSVEFNDGGTIKTKYMYVQLSGEIWNSKPIGARAGFLAADLTIKFEAIDKPYWIVESSNNNVVIGPLTNLKYDGTWRKEFSWKLEPYTVVNLLGKYGGFEVDSDADGLADGWSVGNVTLKDLKELVSGINGNAQHISATFNGATQSLVIWFYPQQGHTYYAKTAMKTTTTDPVKPMANGMTGALLAFRDGYHPNEYPNYWLSGAEGYTNVWTIRSGYFTETETFDYRKLVVYITAGFAGANVGETYELWLDNFLLVDLTAMGSLPSGLQAFFSSAGVTKWEELATTNNIVAADGTAKTGKEWLDSLLPYVDSIATLGWKWGE